MKYDTLIERDTAAADLVTLIEQLEPADLPRLELAYRGLSGLHAVLSQLLAPKAEPAKPTAEESAAEAIGWNSINLHRLESLAKQVAEQGELISRMVDEVAGLHQLVTGMAERIAAQSELLGKRAELADVTEMRVTVPADVAEQLAQLANGQAAAPSIPEPATYHDDKSHVPPGVPCGGFPEGRPAPAAPSANGLHPKSVARRERQLEIARLLAASGPLKLVEIGRRLQIPDGSLNYAVTSEWFAKASPDRHAPYALTDAGRQALREAGYIAAAPEVPDASPPEIPPPAPASAPRADFIDGVLSDKARRARMQAQLIAATLAEANTPMTAEGVAREAGLPLEVVEKRLRRHGPDAFQQGQLRYYAKSGDLWSLTDAGKSLACQAKAVAS